MSCIRELYKKRSLPDEVIDLLLASWAPSTRDRYKPYINKWINFCIERNIDPLSPSVEKGAEFLTILFNTGVGYSVVNTARSALSSFIQLPQGISFGKMPIITRLLRGMFKTRPSLPRYMVTYDVNIVFNYLRSLPPIPKISLKDLTFKVVTLLCLLTGQRCQSINYLNIDYMHIERGKIVFYIPKILKTTTPSFHTSPLELLLYEKDTAICAVTHILLSLSSSPIEERQVIYSQLQDTT